MNRMVVTGVVAAAAVAVFLAIALSAPAGVWGPGAAGPPVIEVRDYEGTDLSSIRDFRENSIRGPQAVSITDYRLTVSGRVSSPRAYRYDELLAEFPSEKKVVTLFCVEGWDATILWEGIRVRDILARAGPDPEATTVIFHAADGYSTSLPLGYIVDRGILLAWRMNNVTLPPERGYPFQLVAEDKWGYKWIKWVTTIELTEDSGYRGYWEQRGYSNTADLSRSFFKD